jgi:peptide-methionine (S)-S-oxide reductase
MSRPRAVLIRDYDERAPTREETETAAFALGCFWGPDAEFGAREGVVRTRVGYAGGSEPDPTYHALGDHTEAIQVDYDPAVCSYRDLLGVAFRSHDPRRQTRKVQYQNIVFTASDDQREALDASLAERGLDAETVETRIETLSQFYPAESYHQKYNLKSKRWAMDGFEEAGYDEHAIRESPAAAKLNAHVSGHEVSAPRLLDDQPVRE